MKADFAQQPFTCLVAMGDSITMGAAATRPEYSWVSRLARLISEFQDHPLKVVNTGISGNLISPRSVAYHHPDSGRPSGLERYRRDVIAHQPDLVTVSYGLNDMRCGTAIDLFMSELDSMVRTVREETRAVIVLIGLYHITAYDDQSGTWDRADPGVARAYDAALCRYAEGNGLLYADVFSAEGEADWLVDRDGIHPNNLGHALIANKVFGVLATHCSCLSQKAFREAEDYFRWADQREAPLRTDRGL
jgi:lysophospholipase L1-like esterase